MPMTERISSNMTLVSIINNLYREINKKIFSFFNPQSNYICNTQI